MQGADQIAKMWPWFMSMAAWGVPLWVGEADKVRLAKAASMGSTGKLLMVRIRVMWPGHQAWVCKAAVVAGVWYPKSIMDEVWVGVCKSSSALDE